MKYVFFIILLSALTSGAAILGKFSCKGDFQFFSEPRSNFGQCVNISIESRVSANNRLYITNHYTDCGGGIGHFQDREFQIVNGVLFENGSKAGYISKDILYFVEGTPGEWGYKSFMLYMKNGSLVYEDHLSYLEHNSRHTGICN